MAINNKLNDNSVKRKYKIVVVGSNAVGKTTLLRNISNQYLEKNYIPTLGVNVSNIEHSFINEKNNSETTIYLSIWDIAGQFFTRNLPIHKKFYNGATAAFLIFDLTRLESYEDIPEWKKTVEENVGSCLSTVLVGNKCDLKKDRIVTSEMGLELAKKLDCPYIETSALTGENVKDAFKRIAVLLLEKNKN